MTETCTCWKCGGPLPDLLLPLARLEECPHCRAQLHVCRMCMFFDAAAPQQCREPVADSVSDKQRANFCGWFQLNPHAFAASRDQSSAARRQLDALFGDGPDKEVLEADNAEDKLRKELDDLFGK
jgi:hypothetical protein